MSMKDGVSDAVKRSSILRSREIVGTINSGKFRTAKSNRWSENLNWWLHQKVLLAQNFVWQKGRKNLRTWI